MAEWPTIPTGAGYPLVDADSGEFLSTKVNDALSATIAEAVGGISVSAGASPGVADYIASVIDFGSKGDHHLAIVLDSTWNDGNDPQRKILRLLQNETPTGFGLREYANDGNATTPAFNASPTTVRAGESTPDTGGTVMVDNFNRSGELSGSTSSGGQQWAGTTGSWTGNGSRATVVGTNALVFNAGSKDQTVTADTILVTTSPAATRQLRIIACATTTSPTTGGNYVWAQINISTAGIVTLSLWKRISGVNTQIGSSISPPAGVASNSGTPVAMEVELQVAIQAIQVTFRVAGQSDQVISGTLTETDVTALGTYGGISGTNGGAEAVVDAIEIAIPFTPGSFRGLTVWNGAVGGRNLDWHLTNIDDLFPASKHIDALFIGDGHNNGTGSPADQVADLDAYLTAFKTRHPECRAITIVSENPQFPPATTIDAHAARQRAIRTYAMENGYEYLPVFEAFASRDDGGASLVNAVDGIHPTVSTTTDVTTPCGSLFIALLFMKEMQARRKVGAIEIDM